MQAKHPLNLSEAGIAIHFYMVLITHLLLVIFKYQQRQLWFYRQEELEHAYEKQRQQETFESAVFKHCEDFVTAIGKTIPAYLIITKHERQASRNALLQSSNQFHFALSKTVPNTIDFCSKWLKQDLSRI